jgi:hypothetical protein
MRGRLVAASGLATVLATASTAPAAPPWSEARTIGSPAQSIGRATLAFGPGGTALLSRRVSGGDITVRAQDTDRLATGVPDGTLVERAPLPDQLAAAPLVYGRGRVALLRQTVLSAPGNAEQRLRLGLSLGSVGRPVGPRRPRRIATYTLASNSTPTGPVIAAGPRGALAVAWTAQRQRADLSGRFSVRLALRRPNGRWDRTRTVASGEFFPEGSTDSVAVAFGARGDVVVAYQVDAVPGRAASVSVRTLRRGRRFDRPQRLGPHAGIVDVEARSARNGRVVVAWATQDGGEQADMPSVVRAAIRAPGSRRFGPTQTVDPGEGIERAPGRLCLAMAPDGTALLAWSNVRGRFPDIGYPLRVTIAEPDAGFGPVAELAARAAAADATVRSDGAMLVVLTTEVNDGGLPRQTLAALRPGSGGPFGPPELIAESAPGIGFDRGAAGAFDPRTGRPSVLWSASAGGADTLQLSTRTG